ncbi:hypothetical protein QTP88_007188 [Uroleucon formosanum]
MTVCVRASYGAGFSVRHACRPIADTAIKVSIGARWTRVELDMYSSRLLVQHRRHGTQHTQDTRVTEDRNDLDDAETTGLTEQPDVVVPKGSRGGND